jgi:hypothetical protein
MSVRIVRWLSVVAVVAMQSSATFGADMEPFSAKPIEVLGTFDSAVDDQRAFAVKYRTGQALDDGTAVHSEAAMLWQRYFGDAERMGYNRAVFVAVGHAAGAPKDEKADVVFERHEGAWHMAEVADSTKLDEDYIRAYMGRLDRAEEHKSTSSFLLFLANDWHRTTKSEVEGAKTIADIDRAQFAEVMRRVFLATEEYHHKREIVQIAIDPDGRGARVDSREINRMVMHLSEREATTVARTRHYLQVRGNFVLVTKTSYVIEKTKVSSAD